MRRHTLPVLIAATAALSLLGGCRRTAAGAGNGGGGVMARNALPAAVTLVNVALGDSLFNSGGCQRCHGKGGIGATNAPALDGTKWLQLKTGSFEEIAAIITTGVPAVAIKDPTHKNAMQPRGGRMALTDRQIEAVAAYVYTLSHKQ